MIQNFEQFVNETSFYIHEPSSEREVLNKRLNDVFFEKLTNRPLRKKYSKLPKSYTKVKGTGERITNRHKDEDGYTIETHTFSSAKLTIKFPPETHFAIKIKTGFDGHEDVIEDFIANGMFIEVVNNDEGELKAQLGLINDEEHYWYINWLKDNEIEELISFLEDNI